MNISGDWIRALEGGALIGVSASLMLGLNGRVTGISGIVGGLLIPRPGDIAWRALFVMGLLVGGFIAMGISPAAFSRGVAAPGVVAEDADLLGLGELRLEAGGLDALLQPGFGAVGRLGDPDLAGFDVHVLHREVGREGQQFDE